MPPEDKTPVPARRQDLDAVSLGTQHHAGLALNRYLEQLNVDGETASFYELIAKTTAREVYRRAYQRWHAQLADRDRTRLFYGTLASPLAVGLGNESPTEVGLTLHHTYGMPLIPGSALKGMCRRGALEWQASNNISEKDYTAIEMFLFGNHLHAGRVVFWDAWCENGMPFLRDTVTVHHPTYYQRHGREGWPTDFDDPTPVPFLVVKPGMKFLFAVDAPPESQDFLLDLMEWCLTQRGVGGKRNAGYGFFAVDLWNRLPAARLETLADWYMVRMESGYEFSSMKAKPDANPFSLTHAEADALMRGWSPEQRAEEAVFVNITRRVKEGTPTRILRIEPIV
jgi:CRISPR-associated protein Cmr6